MKLVRINQAKDMIQVDIPEGNGTWAFCTPQVKIQAQGLTLGDEVNLTYTFDNGACDITAISKTGGNVDNGFKCIECGKVLKDGTYKKCYTCNQASKGTGATKQPTGFNCIECNAILKDGTFKKCYNCNQKAKGQGTGAQSSYTPPKETNTGTGGICEDCGATVKDSKYKKCYTCNQKKPAGGSTTSSSGKSESIERQNCNNATSRTLLALAGQLDRNDILAVAETIWQFYYKKLN